MAGTDDKLPFPAPPRDDVARAFIEYEIRESLAKVIAPDAHDMVIAVSLEKAGESQMPYDPALARTFFLGPFFETMLSFFGTEAAEAAIKGLHKHLPRIFAGDAQPPPPLPGATTPRLVPVSVLPSHFGPNPAPIYNPFSKETIPAPKLGPCTLFVASDDKGLADSVGKHLDPSGIGDNCLVVRAAMADTVIVTLKVPFLPVVLLIDARGKLDLEDYSRLRLRRNTLLSVVFWGDAEALRTILVDEALPPRWHHVLATSNLADLMSVMHSIIGAT